MILIFDLFETIVHNRSMDFNRGLQPVWQKYYRDKCTFDEMAALGEELFLQMQKRHAEGKEYAFVKEELPEYARRFGGDTIVMDADEEADFLMRCNDMENMPCIPEALTAFEKWGIPMYVLSNSGFTAGALSGVLEKLGTREYFKDIWSSADFGRIKPCREFFDMAIEQALAENSGQTRENIVFVGDTYASDIKGAHGAGIHAIWLNHKGERNVDGLPVCEIPGAQGLVEVVWKMGDVERSLESYRY